MTLGVVTNFMKKEIYSNSVGIKKLVSRLFIRLTVLHSKNKNKAFYSVANRQYYYYDYGRSLLNYLHECFCHF